MEYRMLGRSGLKVSTHTLGTMNFDQDDAHPTGTLDLKQAARMVDIAIAHGVNIFDTSNAYSRGRSESMLGQIVKDRSNELLVETKVRFPMGDGPNQQGLSRFHIIQQCEASLKRLQRDRIDLYLIHEWDGLTPIEETMEALTMLVRQGKVRYIGCSNLSGWHIMKSMLAAERHHFEKFVCQQIHYTIEAREAEYELMPVALDQGVAIQIWSPIAGGLLSGKFRRNHSPEQSRHLAGWTEPPIRDQERLWRIVDALVEVGEAHGVSAAQVALAWELTRPAVASVVIGARNEQQLVDSLAASSLKLSDSELQKLDDVSLLPLLYPYWHQNWTASGRLGPSDLALHAPHIRKRETAEN